MADFPYRCALIIGVGTGISASLARRLSKSLSANITFECIAFAA
jgi:hypothetical protein